MTLLKLNVEIPIEPLGAVHGAEMGFGTESNSSNTLKQYDPTTEQTQK